MSPGPDGHSGFEDWWVNYPRREGKQAAEKEYESIIRSGRASAVELLHGACRYSASVEGRQQRYVKAPVNWLREVRWTDEHESRRCDRVMEGVFDGGEQDIDMKETSA